MSQQTEDQGVNLPNPAEMAKTYAEVAQRASRLISQFVEKKAKAGVSAPSDELGVAKAFMDLSSRLMANRNLHVADATADLAAERSRERAPAIRPGRRRSR